MTFLAGVGLGALIMIGAALIFGADDIDKDDENN